MALYKFRIIIIIITLCHLKQIGVPRGHYKNRRQKSNSPHSHFKKNSISILPTMCSNRLRLLMFQHYDTAIEIMP